MSAGPTSGGLPLVRVVGVGGAGCKAINRMIAEGLTGVEFVAVETDSVSLQLNRAKTKVRLGDTLTHGLGAGGIPEMGRQAAEAGDDELYEVLRLSDLMLIVCGLGGGTGTGAAPVIARIAREVGALTLGLATRPFTFEGARRRRLADAGESVLLDAADGLILLSNDALLKSAAKSLSLTQAFGRLDELLYQGVRAISDLVAAPALINVALEDVRLILASGRVASIGVGQVEGMGAGLHAVDAAIASPLLERPLRDARRLLFNVTGGPDLSLFMVNDVAARILANAHPGARLYFGAQVDAHMGSQVRVTLFAADFAG